MDIDKRQGDTVGTYGTVALAAGFLVTGVGLVTDGIPAKGFFFAGLLVFTGAALRLEQAIKERHGG